MKITLDKTLGKVLVLGGTGFVGRHVCEKLSRQNIHVTVPTRRRSNAQNVQSLPMLDVLEVNIHDPVALAALVAGHDAVVNLVAVLQAANLDLTILRPSVIFGADDKFLNLFAKLQSVFPVMPLAGAATKFQPVWVEDVAQAVVNSLTTQSTSANAVIEACGPDVLTLKELVQLSAIAAGINRGRGRPVLALPPFLGKLQAMAMRLLTGEPLISQDNLDSMKVDNIASGKLPGLQTLGITPSALAAIVPTYLGNGSSLRQQLAFRKTAGRF